VTVAALSAADDPRALGCTHELRGADPVGVATMNGGGQALPSNEE
jgi:hypothetical protein